MYIRRPAVGLLQSANMYRSGLLLLLVVGTSAFNLQQGEPKAEVDGLVIRGRRSVGFDINDYNSYDDVSSGNGSGIIVLDSLTHALDWIAGATVMSILNKMITGYGSDADVTRMLDAYDFVFIPVMNPDGYEYTWTNDRFWRKNRAENSGSLCRGVDLGRNFAYKWGEPGTLCSPSYGGPSEQSEPETRAYTTFIQSLSRTPIAVISYQAYGNSLLYPYGDCTNPPHLDDVKRVIAAACDAIKRTFGEDWKCGNSCAGESPSIGTSQDWLTGVAGVKYSFTAKLRGKSFTPPPSSIAPSVEQMWNGMVAMVNEIVAIEAA